MPAPGHENAARHVIGIMHVAGKKALRANMIKLRDAGLLRGRNITYDYAEHHLHAEPVLYAGRSFYPLRHNREFTRDELRMLLETAGFTRVEVSFLRSRRHRDGIACLKNIGSALRDVWPAARKSLIAFVEQ